jgi:hypothetical protein
MNELVQPRVSTRGLQGSVPGFIPWLQGSGPDINLETTKELQGSPPRGREPGVACAGSEGASSRRVQSRSAASAAMASGSTKVTQVEASRPPLAG